MSEQQKPLIEYPTTYAFKVMGKHEPDFAEHVRAVFERVLGAPLGEGSIAEVASSKGTYLSLTVSVFLESEDHRRAIYLQLHQEKRILYYL